MNEELGSQAQVNKSDPKVSFFFTTDTPHAWSSGPTTTTWDLERGERIATMERAQELAEKARKGRWGQEGYVRTTYGVQVETDPL